MSGDVRPADAPAPLGAGDAGWGAELTTLSVDGRVVAHYPDGATLDPRLAPRPFLHPVRTLGGVTVSDAAPEDHRWHLGVGVAVQDVDGTNVWGGRTYVRDQGYRWRADHGRVVHLRFAARTEDAFDEHLVWRSASGEDLLTERRSARARAVTDLPGAWELTLSTELAAAGDREVLLGSPATNGREGAGYGGIFWRFPELPGPVRVLSPDAEGEEAVHGSRAPWVAVLSPAAGVVLAGADEDTRDQPWFVRVEGYLGVCATVAAHEPLVLRPGLPGRRSLRALVVDGAPTPDQVAGWAERVG